MDIGRTRDRGALFAEAVYQVRRQRDIGHHQSETR